MGDKAAARSARRPPGGSGPDATPVHRRPAQRHSRPYRQPLAHPAVLSEIHDRPDAGYVAIRTFDPAEGGSPEIEHAPVVGYLAFQRGWLERRAVDPDHCTILKVRGDAMEPTLPDGCSILVDHQRRRRRLGHIFALRTGDDLMVRRAGRDQSGRWVLVSDHHLRPPVPWSYRKSEVAGEVRLMARSCSERSR